VFDSQTKFQSENVMADVYLGSKYFAGTPTGLPLIPGSLSVAVPGAAL
jgi:hypothetical protein